MEDMIEVRRPREYVALFCAGVPTGEGMAYVFSAVDAYTQYAFQLGATLGIKRADVIAKVETLLEHPVFNEFGTEGFTLVLDDFEALQEDIGHVIAGKNGKVLHHPALHQEIVREFKKALQQYLSGGPEESGDA